VFSRWSIGYCDLTRLNCSQAFKQCNGIFTLEVV
jgi:hypothetical protein